MDNKAEIMKKHQRNSMISSLLPLGGLVLITAMFAILTQGQIFNSFNLKTIWNQCFLFIIGGLGMSFLFAQGALDLSIGSVIALCSIFGAFAAENGGVIGCLAVCLITGLICGTITGGLYAFTDIPVFILGLSVSFLIKGTLLRLTSGQNSIKLPSGIKDIFSPIWVSIVVVIVFAAVVYYLFEYTTLGKHSKAIGAGAVAASQSGVNVPRVKWLSYILAGLTAGVVAFLTMMKTGSGGPTTGSNFEFNVMIAMILGGMPSEGGAKSKITACFIGALLISIYTNGMVMLNVDARLVEIIKGVVFIIVVVATYRLQLKAEGKSAGGIFRSRRLKKS